MIQIDKKDDQLEYVFELLKVVFEEEGLKVKRMSKTKNHRTTAYDGIYIELHDKRVVCLSGDYCKDAIRSHGIIMRWEDSKFENFK